MFKHNPLGFHKNAMPAAKAAMAAHRQGKFWEYADLLFTRKQLDEGSYVSYAKELGLDVDKFNADRASAEVEQQILHDQQAVVKLGAGGTPAFFINGKKMSGAQPFPAFKAEVDAAIADADKALASGTKPADLHRTLAARNAGPSYVDWIIDGKPVGGSAAAAPGRPRGDRAAAGRDRAARPAEPSGPVEVAVSDTDPQRGKATAPVTIVIFSDFQ